MIRRQWRCVIVVGVVVYGAYGWWGQSHEMLTSTAIKILPSELPAFFRNGGQFVAHTAVDPDVVKNKMTPAARESESPEHFFDIELLQGAEVPRGRFEFIKLCCQLGVGPEKVGMLPYAVAEWTERLAVAFAEHRRWPRNMAIHTKCLVYAGILAHYCQDMCQPLHVTIHHDGRAKADGSSPRTGIHEKTDGLMERLGLRRDDVVRGVTPVKVDSLWVFLLDEVRQSHALIDTLYAMEGHMPMRAGQDVRAQVLAFATDRARHAVAVTAGLFSYAWRLSERVPLESWLDRGSNIGR